MDNYNYHYHWLKTAKLELQLQQAWYRQGHWEVARDPGRIEPK